MGKYGCMGEICRRSWWWPGDLKGCCDAFLGRKKNNLVFGEELRTVERLRGWLFRKEIWSLK